MPSSDKPFGGPVRLIDEALADSSSCSAPKEDMDLVRQTLRDLQHDGSGILRIYRPQPTAAFSPRDTTLPNYSLAADLVRARGYEPVERGAGGWLAVYDRGALVIDLVAPHPDPHRHMLQRFGLFGEAIVSALSNAGIDARMGAVADEYCPSKYSINAGGAVKLAGLAQRINRRGYHLGAVLSVDRSDQACAAVTEAYHALALPFDPATFGAVTELQPALSYRDVCEVIFPAITSLLDMS